ncbi:DNA-binding domain-containing protein [Methylocystis iwaonis]|uniref:DNA-binding domain-containing protein n=1 Tax=Methylocystis iwaonis TaxID=2885079 RepID=UPI002E7B991F|nr:DNA-binding domain-containing protein [Methylocystis iwaonis]
MRSFDHAGPFAAALLDPDARPPQPLEAPDVARRFTVYRNNVFSSLIHALEAQFPVCRRLVGDDFFRGMAQEYIRRSPPASPVLSEYGVSFPDFVAAFDPALELPYLPDVARLEFDIARCGDAEDATPISNEDLRALSGEQIARSRLHLHPSLFLRSSSYPIVSIWLTNSFDAEVEILDASVAEDALIIRPYRNVEVHRLPAGGFHFMRALAEGHTLASAAPVAQAREPRFDLAACAGLLISSGAIVAFKPLLPAADS